MLFEVQSKSLLEMDHISLLLLLMKSNVTTLLIILGWLDKLDKIQKWSEHVALKVSYNSWISVQGTSLGFLWL